MKTPVTIKQVYNYDIDKYFVTNIATVSCQNKLNKCLKSEGQISSFDFLKFQF